MTLTVESEVADATSAEPLLSVTDLGVRLSSSHGDVYAVNGLSYSASVGRTVAIIGESGCGKTVSSRAIMGLLPDTAQVTGSIRFRGEELVGLSDKQMRTHRGSDISMIFQDPSRSLNPTIKIGDQLMESIRAHLPMTRKQAHERAVELLGLVRLPSPGQRFYEYAHQMSGGMRQRVMIALALACNPKLLIADEATTALDVTTQAQIMNLLKDLQSELGMALIMISHDLGLAASYADDVIVMYAGQSVEQAPTAELFAHVRMPYTKALLEAIPRLDRPPHDLLTPIPGRPPDLSQRLAGCPFAPRCPRAQDKCRAEQPQLSSGEDIANSHRFACWFPVADGESA